MLTTNRGTQCTKLTSGGKHKRVYTVSSADVPENIISRDDRELVLPLEADLIAGASVLRRDGLRLRVIIADDPLRATVRVSTMSFDVSDGRTT